MRVGASEGLRHGRLDRLRAGLTGHGGVRVAVRVRVGVGLVHRREDATPTIEEVAWTDETTWDDLTGHGFVPGTTVGEVHVWVATGSEFTSEPADDTAGTTLVEDHFFNAKLADPAPAVCADGTLALYCSVLEGEGATYDSEPFGWGVWRAAAVPNTVTSRFGAEFVITASTTDNVALSEAIEDGRTYHPRPQYADADPVAVGADWLVFLGGGEAFEPGTYPNSPLQRYQGDEEDGCRAWTAAWGRSVRATRGTILRR